MDLIGLASAREIVEHLFTPPSEGRMTLLKWVLNMTYMVHLPYMGVLVTALTVSLLLNVLHRDGGGRNQIRMAKDLLDLTLVNRAVGAILGVFPILALITCYGQIVGAHQMFSYQVWIAVLLLVTAGLLLVHWHRENWAMRETSWFLHLAGGVLGLGMLMGGYLLLFSNMTLIATPERWPLVKEFWDVLFTWNIIWKFAQWSSMSWALLGASILFFFFFWEERRSSMDESYAGFARKLGSGLCLAFLVQVPVTIALELYNTTNPYFHGGYLFGGQVALFPANGTFNASLVVVALCAIAAHLVYTMLVKRSTQFGAHVFVAILAVFGSWIVGGQVQLGDSLKEHQMVLAAEWTEIEEKIKEEGLGKVETDPEKRLAIGKSVFMAVCISCHDPEFKENRIGPALKSRLERYKTEKTADDLAKWILNGGKAGAPDSANFQVMPGQGVRPRQMPMLIEYMMKKYEEAK